MAFFSCVGNITGLNQGTIYILDYKNDIMYSNWGGGTLNPRIDTNEDSGIYPRLINTDIKILEDKTVKYYLSDDRINEPDNNFLYKTLTFWCEI